MNEKNGARHYPLHTLSLESEVYLEGEVIESVETRRRNIDAVL